MIKSFKLWVDDIRNPIDYNDVEDGRWYWRKSVSSAILLCDMVGLKRIEVISLDHDLGTEDGGFDGYDFMKWLETEVRVFGQPLPEIVCHSSNPAGRRNIEMTIESIKRFLKEGR